MSTVGYLFEDDVESGGQGFLIACTAKDPLFSLEDLWEHNLIPNIEALVAPEGPCHGAQVIFQEDNAGPHTEGIYHEYLNEQFAAGQWRVSCKLHKVWSSSTIRPCMIIIYSLSISISCIRSILQCVGPEPVPDNIAQTQCPTETMQQHRGFFR